MRCETCYFYQKKSPDNGQCRIKSPLVTGGLHSAVLTLWPEVNPLEWCGEHSTAERTKP